MTRHTSLTPRAADGATPGRLSRTWVAMIALGTLAIGGSAVAYWSITGAGPGSATTGTVVPVTVNQTSTVSGLAPGLPAQALSGTFNNPNSGPVFVTAVTATVTTNKSGCDGSDFVIAGTGAVGHEVAAGTGVDAWSNLTIQMLNKPVNQDACKNALVTIAYVSN